VNRLICEDCGAAFGLGDPRWRCHCGGVLDLEFAASVDLNAIRAGRPTLWRYRGALPIEDDKNIVSSGEGFTPLVEMEWCGRKVFVKHDHLFRTGSFKDRGATVLISKLRELGILEVVEDSSGNAGCAIAAYSADAGIRCTIYVPEAADAAKITYMKGLGAKVLRVVGGREDAAAEALSAAKDTYYASHAWNPFFLHGTKTFAYEVCEQLGWRAPDTLVLPVGNGTLLLGAHIGLKDLLNLGIIDRMPKLIAAQAANCAPLYHAFKAGAERVPSIHTKPTIADGVAVASPVRGKQILEVVRATRGSFVAVEEAEIEKALNDTRERGFSIQPTSAVAIAGLSKYLSDSGPAEVIVTTFTGYRPG
jgi:threonine synthase